MTNIFYVLEYCAVHDKHYAIDTKKIENELGEKAENFDFGIVKTIEW
ncbi:hypothetical protein [Sulfurovum sp.]|nr:hypothetical protein [Sulfurovum sp.]